MARMLNTAPAKLPVFSAAFASDNCAGMCPEASASFSEANCGYAPAYGDDAWTARTCTLLRDLFETDCELFFCFNGTAANSMAIGHLCNSYHSVICHECAHVETDECGGPEFFTNGTKLLLACGDEGKVSPDAVEAIVQKRTDIHYPKPRVLSVTQATELGTVYSIAELATLGELARRHGLRIHMDGARLANAAASLKCDLAQITWKIGVDVLSFGGTRHIALVVNQPTGPAACGLRVIGGGTFDLGKAVAGVFFGCSGGFGLRLGAGGNSAGFKDGL
jgi:threonine aldolase